MSILSKVRAYVRERLAGAEKAPPSQYRDGVIDELALLEGFLEGVAWEEGDDYDDWDGQDEDSY